jgi:hypothetical protein
MKIINVTVTRDPGETQYLPYGDQRVEMTTYPSWSGTATLSPDTKGLELEDLLSRVEYKQLCEEVSDHLGLDDDYAGWPMGIEVDSLDITVSISFTIK